MRLAEVSTMVKVSIEVHNGAALFKVAVRAQSIERAASVVRGELPRLRHQGEVPDRSRRLLRGGARTPPVGDSRGRAAGVHSGLRQTRRQAKTRLSRRARIIHPALFVPA